MRRAPTLDLDEVLVDLLGRPAGAEEAATAPADAATDALLDATTALLGEHGARGWTVEDAAERARVGRATVYRRFVNRDDLMRAAVTREARRFFAAIARSVEGVETLEEKVVQGFLTGVRLALDSPLGSLLRHDPAASVSLLRSEALLRAATAALTERYEAITGLVLSPPARAQVEVSAEALVRMGLSFVLIPGVADPAGRPEMAQERLTALIRPLVRGRS